MNDRNQPTLIDIFDSVVGPGEPAIIQPFVAVASIRLYRKDEGQYRFSIICKDGAGRRVLGGITDILSFSQLPKESITFFYPHGVPAGPLRFGVYEFSIEVGGKQLASTPLYVTQART
jgi:hypothetical protein